jgi:hypothetical protein
MFSGNFSISYLHLDPLCADRINQFCLVSGDSKKTFISQQIRGWLKRNRDYYFALLDADIQARNIDRQEWVRIVSEGLYESLPAPVKHIDLKSDPILEVSLPDELDKFFISSITLSRLNYVLLRNGIHHSRISTVSFLSRVITDHLNRRWSDLYEPHVLKQDIKNW